MTRLVLFLDPSECISILGVADVWSVIRMPRVRLMLMPLLRTPTASSSKRLLILIWSICTFFPTFPYLSHFCQCSVDTIQYNNKSVLAAMWMQFIHVLDSLLVMHSAAGAGCGR